MTSAEWVTLWLVKKAYGLDDNTIYDLSASLQKDGHLDLIGAWTEFFELHVKMYTEDNSRRLALAGNPYTLKKIEWPHYIRNLSPKDDPLFNVFMMRLYQSFSMAGQNAPEFPMDLAIQGLRGFIAPAIYGDDVPSHLVADIVESIREGASVIPPPFVQMFMDGLYLKKKPAILALDDAGFKLKLYNCPGLSLDYVESVFHQAQFTAETAAAPVADAKEGAGGKKRQTVTQAAAAAMCHVSEKTIRKWESGQNTPDKYPGRYNQTFLRIWAENYRSGKAVNRRGRAIKNALSLDRMDHK
jgi:hypothetical protein